MDDFSLATSSFVNNEDLKGRLLLIYPTAAGERPSTLPKAKEGDMYEYVIADVHVLSGKVTDKIDAVPLKLEDQQLAGASLVPQLKRKVGTGKAVLGIMSTTKSRWGTDAWILAEPDGTQVDYATAYLKDLRAREARAEMASAAAGTNDPFA